MVDYQAFSPKPLLPLTPLSLSNMVDPALPSLCYSALEDALRGFEAGWPHFIQRIQQAHILDDASIDLNKPWEAEMIFVGNAACHVVNRDYRGKDQPTDVITFTLYADDPNRDMLAQLPVHHLGSVLVNVDWAAQETGITWASPSTTQAGEVGLQIETDWGVRDNLTPTTRFVMYILERMLHGCLHLLGVTHDTEADYNRVVEIQRYVLDAVHRQRDCTEPV